MIGYLYFRYFSSEIYFFHLGIEYLNRFWFFFFFEIFVFEIKSYLNKYIFSYIEDYLEELNKSSWFKYIGYAPNWIVARIL